MANSANITADLDSNFFIEIEEGKPAKSVERDKYGNILPELKVLSAGNIMPARHGYTSFFGLEDLILNDDTVLADIQNVISYRTKFGETVLLALCADGVYLKALAGNDLTATIVETATEITITAVQGKCSWKKGCYSSIPSPNKWKLWSVVLLENKLYLYQKGMDYIAYFTSTNPGVFVFEKLEPSYIISTVPAAFSWIIDMDQEYGNSTYKTLDIGFGRSTVYPASSSDALETANDLVTVFNDINDGNATLSVTSSSPTITDIDAQVVVNALPDDFLLTALDGSLLPYITIEEYFPPAINGVTAAPGSFSNALFTTVRAPDGYIYAAGSYNFLPYIVKYDPQLNIVWQYQLSSGGIINHILVVGNSLYLVGQGSNNSALLLKFDIVTQTFEWGKEYYNTVSTILITSFNTAIEYNGDIICIGSGALLSTNYYGIIAKFDASGNLIQEQIYDNGVSRGRFDKAIKSKDGLSLYITGIAETGDTADRALVLKVNIATLGITASTAIVGSTSFAEGYELIEHANGNITVRGSSFGATLWHYNSSLVLQWQKEDFNFGTTTALYVHPTTDNVILVARKYDGTLGKNIGLFFCFNASGVLQWAHQLYHSTYSVSMEDYIPLPPENVMMCGRELAIIEAPMTDTPLGVTGNFTHTTYAITPVAGIYTIKTPSITPVASIFAVRDTTAILSQQFLIYGAM